MLNPNNDRLDYGQILAPPAGYDLDFAVGTTYSLDLDALVGASLALGLSEETDSELMNNPVCLLEALRSTGDKVALFCEGGQIHMPNRVTALYVLLEKMVFSVRTAKRRGSSRFPTFHPKFWLIRYKNNNRELVYRIIVLSRNLTFDRSWDVTYYMDGHVTDDTTDKNEPICDFLRYLISQLPADENGKEKARGIRALIRELPKVVFETGEKTFYDYEFIPNGVKNSTQGGFYSFDKTDLFQDTFHEILIISPFLTGDIIKNFNERNKGSMRRDARYMLITREMSLGRLKPGDVSNFVIYTMRDQVIDGETAISEGAQEIRKQDIHAKMYMVRKYSNTDLYLGSLNATHSGVHTSIEFMVRLRSKNRYLNMDKMTADLFGSEKDGSDNPFQVTLQNAIIDEEDEKDRALDTVIKSINRSNPYAVVKAEDEEHYSVSVSFDACDTKDFRVLVRPLLSKKTEEFSEAIIFAGLTVTQLSEFYVVSVSDGERVLERVLIIPTEGLPEDCEKQVISSVVSNRDCFYRYIAFLLGDDAILSVLETNAAEGDPRSNMNRQAYHIPALYEKMLQTAAVNPEKFKGIEYLMRTISDDGIIPEDFKKLYKTFKKAVKFNG